MERDSPINICFNGSQDIIMKTSVYKQEKREIIDKDAAIQIGSKEKWFVLVTKSRAEKKVAEDLQKLGLEAYCPTVVRVKEWSDRKKKIVIPLIPSIIFVKIEENKRDLLFQNRGVVRYLYWLGKPAVVGDAEIQTMQEWLKNGSLDPRVEHLKPGDRVSIDDGPFKGQKAILKETTKNSMQLLLVALGIKITISKPKEVWV